MGFSAGAHLIASLPVVDQTATTEDFLLDGQVLIYPSLDGSDWLEWKTCGWFDKQACSKSASSLVKHQDAMHGGDGFKAVPTFLVSSIEDTTCPPETNGDVYERALTAAKVPCVHIRRPLGDHGFGLEGEWTIECVNWIKSLYQSERPNSDIASTAGGL